MATIFGAVASADRLNATLARFHQVHFERLSTALAFPQSAAFGQISASLAAMNQVHFERLNVTLAQIYQTEFAGLAAFNANLTKTWKPLIDTVLAMGRFSSLAADSASNENDGLLQRLSDREIAAMLTTVAFLFVYISFALLIKHDPKVAKLAVTDGPTPFEAAMAVGALVFWLSLNHFGGSRGE
jgi:hypothetical protein